MSLVTRVQYEQSETQPFGVRFLYGFVAGLGFLLIPMVILDLFQLSAGDDVWIRFVGILASILGVYYILVARSQMDRFIPWTVATRYYAAAFMVLMVGLGKMGPGLLLFAAIDASAGTWTWLAVRTAVRENAESGDSADGGARRLIGMRNACELKRKLVGCMQSLKEFPPRQEPGSFNLDRVIIRLLF